MIENAKPCQKCKSNNLHMANSIGHYQVQCDDCGYYGQAAETEKKALSRWNRPNHLEDDVCELYRWVLDEMGCHARGEEKSRQRGFPYDMDYQRGMKDAYGRMKTIMGMSFKFLDWHINE
jgi:hypothetical protein